MRLRESEARILGDLSQRRDSVAGAHAAWRGGGAQAEFFFELVSPEGVLHLVPNDKTAASHTACVRPTSTSTLLHWHWTLHLYWYWYLVRLLLDELLA